MLPADGSLADTDFYLYDVDKESGVLRGFHVKDDLRVRQMWSMSIPSSHELLFTMAKPYSEKVAVNFKFSKILRKIKNPKSCFHPHLIV